MTKFWKIAISTAVAFVAAAVVTQNLRHQWAVEERMEELQRQIAQHASKPGVAPLPAALAAAPNMASVTSAGPSPGTYAERQDNILKIMKAGWGLIDKRSPEAAKQAAAIFQEGLDKVDAASPDLYNGLGRALLIAGQPKEAIAAWRKGLTLAPQFADMQSGIGWAYWHLGDAYDAKKAWEAAVAVDSKCVDAWSALAWIDMATGNKERSVEGFQALVAFDDKRTAWVTGLSMARAGNRNLPEINGFFPLPTLEAFQRAPARDPATTSTAPTS